MQINLTVTAQSGILRAQTRRPIVEHPVQYTISSGVLFIYIFCIFASSGWFFFLYFLFL